jgi:mannose-1-phosphate guanylyltransferase
MAGGSGTRFWPASRRDCPKQFLSLLADRPLIRSTFDRIRPLIPAERTWVVTTAATAALVREVLPELAADQVLTEPIGRDTAACAGLAALAVQRRDPGAVCAVLPADHVISGVERFRDVLAAGAQVIEREGGLLTFGVRPTRPETGFGYLKLGGQHGVVDRWKYYRLDRFVEKPDPPTARVYLEEGGYLWNSGMFVWSVAELLDEIRRQLPELAAGLDELGRALGTKLEIQVMERVYPSLPRISVDHGIMEGAERCWTIPVDFPWSDVGSWPALGDLMETDEGRNAVRGRVLAQQCSDNILIGDGPVVAVAGIRDLIVVATPDAVLVVPASEAQRVKELVAAIEERGWGDVL